MVRKLSLAVALVLGITPIGAYAVGLGNIHLKSALNQYFDAEIDLLSVDQGEIEDIKVTLASPDAFRRSGIERPFILSKLRFQADQVANGKTIIRVSSRDPIREPFLNFLIEVNWPKGKLLREYTVLLDPPVTLDRRPAPVQPASMQKRSPQPGASPRKTSASTSTVSVAADTSTGNQYGPTRRNDTLWGIARQVRTEGASMAQMMIALQRANPQAFIDQNVNNLKVGQILRVPKANEVLELTGQQAAQAYRAQLQDWQVESKPEEMTADSTPATGQMPMAKLDEAAVVPEAELKIASARPTGKGAAGPSEGADQGAVIEQMRQELIVAEEAKQAALQETESARTRVDDLESQLEDLQRLLSLKSEQLAKLQAVVTGRPENPEVPMLAPGGDGGTATELSVLEPSEPEGTTANTTVEGEGTESAKPEALEGVTSEAPPQPESDKATQTEESPVLEGQPQRTIEPVVPAVVESAPKTTPVAPLAVADKGPGLLKMIAGDATLLGVAVAGIVVLLALLWVAISRRRSNSADFQESILVSTVDEGDSEQVMEALIQEPAAHPTEETSFLSDFSPSDIDALQDETGEVDPVAEADVYIAYGRYQQAEELIRQAIDKYPERTELKQKLFEILFATKDTEAFIVQAEQAAAEGLEQKDSTAWGKVVAMGAQLASGHALFAHVRGEETRLNDEELAALEEELGLDDALDLDEVSTTVGLIASDQVDELESIAPLDLGDLDDLTLDEGLYSGIDEPASQKGGTLSLPEEDGTDVQEDRFSLEEDSLSLDQDTDLRLVNSDSTAVGEADSGSELDMTLNSLDGEGLLGEESAFSIEDPLERAELDDLRLDADTEAEQLGAAVIDFSESDTLEGTDSTIFDSLGLDQPDTGAALDSDLSFSLDDLDQDDGDVYTIGEEEGGVTDEINTKLDLARAYVDMEDVDGAKIILEEVWKEGSEGQKQEAQQLLDQLS